MTLLSEQVVIKKIEAGRSINNAIFLFYILLFAEGILRKWILPPLSSPLFFIKDPVLFYMYWMCWRHRIFPKSVLFQASVILLVLYLILSLTQMLLYTTPFFASVYGWRNYFLYMPLAFIMQRHMTKSDLVRIAKFTCYFGIPIAVLAYMQFLSPPDAFINRNAGENSGVGFTVVGNIVRPYGPFSFVSGMAFFTPSLIVMLIYNYFLPKQERFLSNWMAVACFCAFSTCLAVSGSRGTYGSTVVVFVFLIIGLFMIIRNTQSIKSLFVIMIGGVIVLNVYNVIFSTQLDIMSQRMEQAEIAEGSMVDRFATNFIRFQDISTELPVLGAGIGAGSAGANFLKTGVADFTIAESDWGRIVVECGVFFGFMYLFYRIILTLYMSIGAIKATIRGVNPLPVVLVGYEIQNLLVGQMVSVGTNLAFGWFYLGIALVFNKIYSEEKKDNYVG
ncbi:hypothetical protein [Flavobacterium sp.]|uniref:hypothetical protein n=1 Tax=Flavobacterium sp. TaxID=239 RepID=UPI0025C08E88|nr:hypothetical protein [Flavobacterium sp.]